MARPLKDGLDYFNHDVEMSNDIKIKKLENKFGLVGYAIFNKILEQIYKYNGDFSLSTKEDLMLYSKDWNIEIKLLKKIISYSIEIKLFENEKLSSNSIRKRLQKIQDDRKYKREYAERKKAEAEKNKDLDGVLENKTTSNGEVIEDKEKNSKEKNSSNLLEDLLLDFSTSFKVCKGIDYVIDVKDRKAMGLMLQRNKEANPKENTEQVREKFKNLFDRTCAITDNEFLSTIAIWKLNSQINQYMQYIQKPASKVDAKLSKEAELYRKSYENYDNELKAFGVTE